MELEFSVLWLEGFNESELACNGCQLFSDWLMFVLSSWMCGSSSGGKIMVGTRSSVTESGLGWNKLSTCIQIKDSYNNLIKLLSNWI